jgi:hypothetical protein
VKADSHEREARAARRPPLRSVSRNIGPEAASPAAPLSHLAVLRYPNGRTIERSIPAGQAGMRAGHEFTMAGRRWRVGQVLPATRRSPDVRAMCGPVDALSPLLEFRASAER